MRNMWLRNGNKLVNGPSPLHSRDVPVDMRSSRIVDSRRLIRGLGELDRPLVGTELINGPTSLSYRDTPIDMWPRNVDNYQRNPDGSIVSEGPMSPLDALLNRIAQDTGILSSVATLRRGLFGRTVTVTSTPQLIINAEYLRGYIILNPNELAGATAAGTLLASASRGAATANLTGTSSTLGVANFLSGHFYCDFTAFSGGASVDLFLQTLDPASGNWVDSQQIAAAITTPQTLYAYVGELGVATDARVRWNISAGNATFSVGYVLKNGLIGTSSGVSQTIYLGGAGVTTASGFPLLNGQSEKFFLEENVQLYAVAGASLPLKIFEL